MYRFSLLKSIGSIVLAMCLLVPPAVSAQSGGKGKSGRAHKQSNSKELDFASPGSDRSASLSIGFEEARRLAVANRIVGNSALPPGIRKNLARGKALPPGIAKKTVPGPMLEKLPAYPGYEWRICGSDLVRVAVATTVIAEVISNVFE